MRRVQVVTGIGEEIWVMHFKGVIGVEDSGVILSRASDTVSEI